MFETCHDLTSLNEERARLYREQPNDIMEINNWYNARRKELTTVRPTYKKMNKFVYKSPEFKQLNAIHYMGRAPQPNLIMMTSQGFFA